MKENMNVHSVRENANNSFAHRSLNIIISNDHCEYMKIVTTMMGRIEEERHSVVDCIVTRLCLQRIMVACWYACIETVTQIIMP